MNPFRRKPDPANDLANSAASEATAGEQVSTLSADIGYQKLEPRQVLSASFVFGMGGLILDGFDAGQDLSLAQQNANINGTLQDAYVFDVAQGSWAGDSSNPFVEIESVNGGLNNRLEIGSDFFGGAENAGFILNGLTSTGTEVGFTQTSPTIAFDTLDISNFTNVERAMTLNTIGDLTASDLTIADANPFDAFMPPVDLQLQSQGTISIDGLQNQILHADADITVVASGQHHDVHVVGAVQTGLGDIRVQADDSVIFASTGSLLSADDGRIEVDAGLDGDLGDDNNQIRMTDGSVIDAGTGSVELDTVFGGDILLGDVTTLEFDDAIRVNSGLGILDATTGEDANLSAINGRIHLVSFGPVGGAGTDDINIQSQFLHFNTTEIHVTDHELGLTIDQNSVALRGGEVRSHAWLAIEANLNLGASTTFASGISATANDDITIGNGANIELASITSSTLEFVAGDDIIFDSGQINTTLLGRHAVVLTADAEGSLDSDRGSITNLAGTMNSIATNDLSLVAFDGIGDSSDANSDQPLRINVDRLTAINSGINDILIEESGSLELTDLRTNDGAIVVAALGQIDVVSVRSGENESAEDDADDVTIISRASSVHVTNIESADDLTIEAKGNIRDMLRGQIIVQSDATMTAGNVIALTDGQADLLQVAGNSDFEARRVLIGLDQMPAGSGLAANTFLGTFSVTADEAILIEDDGTVLEGTSTADNFSIASGNSIENQTGTRLIVSGHSQFNAADSIELGAALDDEFNLNRVGLVAKNVHFEIDSSIEIDAKAPDQTSAIFGQPASFGTAVEQTLFLTSTGSIQQSNEILDAQAIGLEAAEHIHLARIAGRNDALALSAGTAATLTDPTTIQTLNALGNVINGEVDAGLPQSIALIHDGNLNIGTVDSPFNHDRLSGLTTTDGSLFAMAVGEISIQKDVVAQAANHDPQVTLYSESGNSNQPGIQFEGGRIEVNGPQNFGIVNETQTTATFFDQDGFVLKGTTEILLLNTDGTANQNIVIDYGHAGESGYRVGIVWDKDNLPGLPVETINTFVSDPGVASEAYEDSVYQTNPATIHLIGDNEGGRETFPKIDRYTKAAIINHNESPNVFSTVTVRNDQDINLFSGSLQTVDNSLNEISQTLRAELDSPKRSDPLPPKTNAFNPIEIKSAPELLETSSSPDDTSSFTFSRDVQPFETGQLKWVLVKIPMSELEEVGDEIKLKDPTRNYLADDNAKFNPLDVGENEVEKIIAKIEQNTEAEAGYWYKVFKDYQNRDDELFFYHFKTGEPQQDSVAPDSDFEPERQPLDEPIQLQLDDSEESLDDETRPQPIEPNGLDPLKAVPPNPTSAELSNQRDLESIPTPSKIALSATGLLMAGLVIRNAIQSETPDPNHTTDQEPKTKFGRLDRLKRKLQDLLNQPS